MLYCTVKSKAQQNWLRRTCCFRRLLSIHNASCTDGCLYNILVQNLHFLANTGCRSSEIKNTMLR